MYRLATCFWVSDCTHSTGFVGCAKKAFEYATIAADDDDSEGFFVLGTLYVNGWGVEKDLNRALDNYKMAAALGDAGAMNKIGIIFMGDEGIEANPEQSYY